MDTRLFWISFGSAIVLSFANLIIKKLVDGLPLLSALLYRNLAMLPFTGFMMLVFTGGRLTISMNDGPYIFISGALGYAGMFCFFKAMQVTSTPGLIAGLSSCSSLMVLFFGLWFGIPISLNALPGVFFILAGILIVSTSLSNFKESSLFKLNSGIPYILLTMIFWGVSFNMFGIVGARTNPFWVFLLINIVELCMSGFLIICTNAQLEEPPYYSVIPFAQYGLLVSLGFSGQLYAMSHASPGLVSSIISSSTIFSLIIARFWLSEKLSIQKYIGMAIVFCGLTLISIVK
jgi:drug/metabolite transporter (DMT)-like permease